MKSDIIEAGSASSGQRFGRWTIIGSAPRRMRRSGFTIAQVECRCDCGTVRRVDEHSVRSGNSTSCGCFNRDNQRALHLRHGLSKQPIYNAWRMMISRCENPTVINYPNYGGRGITVCERWHKFENFLEDMGHRPTPKHTVDRKDNERGYSPENCRWATQLEQQRNRRNNRKAH